MAVWVHVVQCLDRLQFLLLALELSETSAVLNTGWRSYEAAQCEIVVNLVVNAMVRPVGVDECCELESGKNFLPVFAAQVAKTRLSVVERGALSLKQSPGEAYFAPCQVRATQRSASRDVL